MLKGFLVIIALLFIIFAIGLMILFRAVHQGIRRFKQMMGMEDGEDTSSMHSKNYTGKRQQPYEFRPGQGYGSQSQDKPQGGTERRTQDAHHEHRQSSATDGESIIDQRNSRKSNRKIFAEDEGEYVDYIEEK